jgi:cytochrome c-type biogenesis protein CcmF
MGPSTEAGILGSLTGDVYVLLAGWEASGAVATFRAYWNPLVAWIWIGLYFVMGGTLFAIWPRRRRKAVAEEEQAVFRSLSELEYDFRMGKIGADDYQQLKSEMTERIAAAVTQAGRSKTAVAGRKKKGEGPRPRTRGKKAR